jgi:PHS family inorganic phosphate transporter-like MFS transporter
MRSANGDAAPNPSEPANVFTRFIRDLRKNFWIDPTVVIETSQVSSGWQWQYVIFLLSFPLLTLQSNAVNRQQVTLMIDKHGFDYKVWLVASSGFFTDSYNLFAANVILPSLGYIYWPTTTDQLPELKINVSTLFGSLVGMLVFGFLADIYGRRKLYGLELIVVIFGTLGIVQASIGYDNSMNIMGWLIFWRFFMGMGIGAEYPLSAVITAE